MTTPVLCQDFWQQTNGPPTTSAIWRLAVDSDGHIFAGCFGPLLYRSTNNGDAWTQLSLALPIRSLAVKSDGHVFVGTNTGIYQSTDNGDTWSQLLLSAPNVHGLVFNSSGHVFAGAIGCGVYRSTDDGAT
jgi:ligand-binding sensor domain-containing protein